MTWLSSSHHLSIKAPYWKCFSSIHQNAKHWVVFKFLRVDERSRKAAFSWRISVDGRPICRNKVAFSDSSHGEWKGTKFQLESYPIYRYCKAQKLSRQMINDSFICPFLNLPSKCSFKAQTVMAVITSLSSTLLNSGGLQNVSFLQWTDRCGSLVRLHLCYWCGVPLTDGSNRITAENIDWKLNLELIRIVFKDNTIEVVSAGTRQSRQMFSIQSMHFFRRSVVAENLCVPYQFYKHQMLKFALLRFFMSRIKYINEILLNVRRLF